MELPGGSVTRRHWEWTDVTSCAVGGATTQAANCACASVIVSFTGVVTSSVRHVETWWTYTRVRGTSPPQTPGLTCPTHGNVDRTSL